MATHCRIPAWESLWTEEPGGARVHGIAKESDTTERLDTGTRFMGQHCTSTSLCPAKMSHSPVTMQLISTRFALLLLPW